MFLVSATTAATPTCDYRLVEESRYSNFTLPGFSTNTSICMNSFFSAINSSGTIQDFIDVPNATILYWTRKIAYDTLGGAATTSLVILDLEWPVYYNGMHLLNTSTLAALVAAIRRRVQIARTVLPHAKIGLYDEHAANNATVVEGYRRASRLGLWDDVDYLIPVLYLPIGRNATNATLDVLLATAAGKTTSRGDAVPMAPLLSWLYFPYQCAVPFDVNHAVLDTIDRFSQRVLPIPIVQFWSGKDNETSKSQYKSGGRNHSCPMPPIAQQSWLERANAVPERCLPRGGSAGKR